MFFTEFDYRNAYKIGYLGGILDGEGSIGIEKLSPCKNRKKIYYVCRVTIINTSLPLMEWLKSNFGGNFDKRKQVKDHKICYRWHIFGKNLEDLLNTVIDSLLIKRPQAELLLQYRKTVGKTGWNVSDETLQQRESLWLKCKEFNSIGHKRSSPLSRSP